MSDFEKRCWELAKQPGGTMAKWAVLDHCLMLATQGEENLANAIIIEFIDKDK